MVPKAARLTAPTRLGAEPTDILDRIRSGLRVRRNMPPWGRLSLDRPLPFLCIYRKPVDREDPGTAELVTSQASYLMTSGDPNEHARLAKLIRTLGAGLSRDFGAFLIVEIWSRHQTDANTEAAVAPRFRLVTTRESAIGESVDALESVLARIRISMWGTLTVDLSRERNIAPPGMAPLMTTPHARSIDCHFLGIEVPAIYVDAKTGHLLPPAHRTTRREMSAALKRAEYQFTRNHTRHRPAHYHALGSRSVTKRVFAIDGKLAALAGQFDFLLLSTPRNIDEAWAEFKRGMFQRRPHFSYRPRPFDTALAKRELYRIPLERIEDPTLYELFREQQTEIDRKLTMIGDRESKRFRYESLQLFGDVEKKMVRQAHQILDRIPSRAREALPMSPVTAAKFATRAQEEIDRFREQHPDVRSKVLIRPDIAGLMVSSGNLLIGTTVKVPASRVEAMIQHEVGTHILTHCNGAAQPLKQLRTGLPGYEELQEGLAVLAEYLVGGLSRPRFRLLAARVVAVRHMLDGATFVEVFRELDRVHDFEQRVAFNVTMRVFRGGGHTKDAVYLRGLARVLEYLGQGHSLEPLYVGKMGLDHLPVIDELRLRKVLVAPVLRPQFLDRPDVKRRLERLEKGMTLKALVEHIMRRKKP